MPQYMTFTIKDVPGRCGSGPEPEIQICEMNAGREERGEATDRCEERGGDRQV